MLHADAVDQVKLLIMAEPATSRQQQRDRKQVSAHLCALADPAQPAGGILEARSMELLDLPDNRHDSLDWLVLSQQIGPCFPRCLLQVVFRHYAGDVNVNRRRLHEAVASSCRPTPSHAVGRLLSFEVTSSADWQPHGSEPFFQPNWLVDISAQWPWKRQGMAVEVIEMRPWLHTCSPEALAHLARWRGAQVGLEAAETFCLPEQKV